jgi:regulator of protease activity HflC (stomatin/prohibitin superfamily)
MGFLKFLSPAVILMPLLRHLKFFVRVQTDERALLLKNGKVVRHGSFGRYKNGQEYRSGDYVEYPQGLYFFWPLFYHVEKEKVKPTTIKLEEQGVTFRDGLSATFSARLQFKIVDLRTAKMDVNNFTESLVQLAEEVVYTTLWKRSFGELNDMDDVNAEAQRTLTELSEWMGVEIVAISVRSFHLCPESERTSALRARIITGYNALEEAGIGNAAIRQHPAVVAALIGGGSTTSVASDFRQLEPVRERNGNGHDKAVAADVEAFLPSPIRR